MAGRSLREVENRVSDLDAEVGIALVFTLVVTFAAALVLVRPEPS